MSNAYNSVSKTDAKSGADENYPYVIARFSEHLNETRKQHLEEIKALQAKHEAALNEKNREFAIRVADLDVEKKMALADMEFRFKTSLTWRLGSIPLNIIKFIRNFLFNPIRFFSSSAYRLKDIERRPRKRMTAYPKPEIRPAPAETQKQMPEELSIDKTKPVILGIFDTFTYNCFKPEFNILSPSPETWQETLEKYPVQALFIESAWHGNDDTWLYQIGKYNNENNKKLKELVAGVKSKNIPLIFWNKEDPVHFDKFMVAAELVDHVFTTDADCIPGYIKQVGHERVYALPFAAQEKIHNPIRIGSRTGKVCFAGTYHVVRYAERQSDMEILLKPALKFGLDIYDRMFGTVGKEAEKYIFPDIYQPSIRGKLNYDEMIQAYKNYKVFLNVNSVRNSPTMFARRVFELLASGTPVISTYSKGITEILGETVLITESESDTRKHLEMLLNDEDYWWKKSLEGMRKVHESHTYYHRSREILNRVGIKMEARKPVSFLAIAKVSSTDDLDYLLSMLKNQFYQSFDLLLMTENTITDLESISKMVSGAFPKKRVKIIPVDALKSADHTLFNTLSGKYAAFFKPENFYGRNYLRDYAIAIQYAGARRLGKKSVFKTGANNRLQLINKGCEYNYMADVNAGSMVLEKSLLTPSSVMNILVQDTYFDFEIQTLSIDPYNFIIDGKFLEKVVQQKAEA
jgi:spore maturation protein CgeB